MESGESVGVLVDEVQEVVTLNSTQVERNAHSVGDAKAGFVSGVGKDKDRLISLLDINASFAEKEA